MSEKLQACIAKAIDARAMVVHFRGLSGNHGDMPYVQTAGFDPDGQTKYTSYCTDFNQKTCTGWRAHPTDGRQQPCPARHQCSYIWCILGAACQGRASHIGPGKKAAIF